LPFFFLFFLQRCLGHRDLHSFPTRRSSDLSRHRWRSSAIPFAIGARGCPPDGFARKLRTPNELQRRLSLSRRRRGDSGRAAPCRDRKSTRLNSSHLVISYAVFCLKKKKKNK